VNPAVEYDLFALLDLVPSRNEIFEFASAAVGSFRYLNAFVRSVAAVKLPYVKMVSKYDRLF